MVTIFGKIQNNSQWIEWRYIHDDDTHFVQNHYTGEYVFCATFEGAKAAFERYKRGDENEHQAIIVRSLPRSESHGERENTGNRG